MTKKPAHPKPSEAPQKPPTDSNPTRQRHQFGSEGVK